MIDTCGATASTITVYRDLADFFRENITTVRERRHYRTTLEIEAYLAGMLADCATTESGLARDDRPLTVQLVEALGRVGTERFSRLRQIGDGALYTTSFFGEYLERRGVETGYVEQLGARAYATAGRMMVTDRAKDSSLLEELATRFHHLGALLHEVAELLRVRAARTPGALLQLYERWLQGGSESLAKALASEGLVPLRPAHGLQ